MTFRAGEEIAEEGHSDRDQFFRFESVEGAIIIDGNENPRRFGPDFALIVPAGAGRNVKNTVDAAVTATGFTP